jgi:carbohydrate-selective porin OprB
MDGQSQCLIASTGAIHEPPTQITFTLACGLSHVGLFEDRPNDAVSLIAATGVFSDDLSGQNAETILEANYRFQVLPALHIQPDVPYIIDPDGRSDIDDALVIGFSLGAVF